MSVSKITIIILMFSIMVLSQRGFAQESTDLSSLSTKLDKMLSNQEKILSKLDAMTEEINIVKIRCSR